MQQARLWSGAFVLSMAINLVLGVIFYLLMTTMALYAVERFGAPDALAGLAASAFVLGAVVSRLFAGRFTDLLGRRRVLIISLAVYVIAGVAYFAADSLVLLIVIRLLHGIAFGAGASAVTTVAMALVPAERRGEGSGYFAASATLAAALGPFAAIAALESYGHEGLFWAGVICSAVGLVFALLLRAPERELHPGERSRWWRLRMVDLVEPAALRIGIVILVTGLGYAGILTFLASFAEQAGMAWATTWFFVVYGVVVLAVRLVLGRVQDTRGDNIVIYPALASFVVGLVILAFAGSSLQVALSAVFVGLGFGVLIPGLQAIAVNVSPPHRLAVAVSAYYLMLDIGVGIGPLLLGLLLPLLGFTGLYLLLAGAVLVAAVIYFGVHGRRTRPLTATG